MTSPTPASPASPTPELSLPAELLLLVLDDEQGKPLVDGMKRRAGVAGAAVLQLVIDGALQLGPGEPRHAQLVAGPAPAPASAALGEARERALDHTPKQAVARIGGGSDFRGRADTIQESVLAELAELGVIERVRHTRLGIFGSTRWMLRRPEVESAVRNRIAAVLDGGQPDPRTGALVGLANAVGVLPKVFPDRDRAAMRRRAEQVEELGWGGEAVSEAIRQVQAAVLTAVLASSVTVRGSG